MPQYRYVDLYELVSNSYLVGQFVMISFLISSMYMVLVNKFNIQWRNYQYGITDSLPTVLIEILWFSFITIMMVMACFQAIYTDPGRVPPYWGFWLGDLDQKRKRYCLQCHIFKPERTHHCSNCGRCVLNMDHHCPWLNNCVGFYNRKFFILYLIYCNLALLTVLMAMGIEVFNITYNRVVDGVVLNWSDVIVVMAFYLDLFLTVFLSMFLKFHLNLIINNRTTIENMEIKRSGTVEDFNQGPLANLYYIFGKDITMWPFPWFGESGRPFGDGVTWGKRIRELEIFSDNSASLYAQNEMNLNYSQVEQLRNQIEQISRGNQELIDLNSNMNQEELM